MAKQVIPPAGLSGIDSMAWIREAGCLVALGHPTEKRYIWKTDAFEDKTASTLRWVWRERNCERYSFKLPPHIIVIDIDGENAAERWREMQAKYRIQNTRIIRTPSGGLHVYLYRDPETPIRHGVNVLADHGFGACDVFTKNSALISGPGSYRRETAKKCAGVYRWVTPQKDLAHVTDSLADALTPPPVPEIEYGPQRTFSGEISPYAQATLDGVCGTLANTSEGSRNHQLYSSACRLGNLVGNGDLPEGLAKREIYAAAAACGLVVDEGQINIQNQIRNGIARGKTTPRVERPSMRGGARG